ncbi:N-ethylmaleimide reductase [Marinibacterium anthonyi]|nr:N-ethylmaleimide reductase [Marinibacterium anthonyi]
MGPMQLANRVVMAPLTRARANAGATPGPLAPTYYRQRSGAGLIVAEATVISEQGVGFSDVPGLYAPHQVSAWQEVTRAVHDKGGLMFVQLWHVGRMSHPDHQNGALPVAPSAVDFDAQVFTAEGMKDAVRPRALELDEIPGIVGQYGSAAASAREAGFDGVEIHGTAGMLPMQFLHSGSNLRDDIYGGSVENRARFVLEVIDACIAAAGPGRVGIRVGPHCTYGNALEDNSREVYTYLFGELNKRPMAYVHLVEGLPGRYPEAPAQGEQSYLDLLRSLYDGTIIVAGGYDPESAERVLTDGVADAVAFGSLFIGNPDLPDRIRNGYPLVPADPAVFYGGGARGYTDYPAYIDRSPGE